MESKYFKVPTEGRIRFALSDKRAGALYNEGHGAFSLTPGDADDLFEVMCANARTRPDTPEDKLAKAEELVARAARYDALAEGIGGDDFAAPRRLAVFSEKFRRDADKLIMEVQPSRIGTIDATDKENAT